MFIFGDVIEWKTKGKLLGAMHRPFWVLVTPSCCEPPKDVFPCCALWTLIYIQGLLVITYTFASWLAAVARYKNINRIRRCVLTKRRGALYTYRIESELALNVGFRFDANLIYTCLLEPDDQSVWFREL